MKLEILNGRVYRGASLEPGRVVEVDDVFARWMLDRGFAKKYVPPLVIEPPAAVSIAPVATDAEPQPVRVKRGRAAR